MGLFFWSKIRSQSHTNRFVPICPPISVAFWKGHEGADDMTAPKNNIWMFPKIGGKPPKWMVKIMVPKPIKMDDVGEKNTLFLG